MSDTIKRLRAEPDLRDVRAMAFDLSPEPSLVISADGSLAAANEAAEALFGQGLSLLVERAVREDSPVRERGLEINLFGQAPFEADGTAKALGDGSVLLTLHLRSSSLVERGGESAAMRSVVGLGRMLAHEIKNPLAGIRGAAQLLKSGAKAEDAPLAQLIVDETDRVRRLVDRMEAFSDDASPNREVINIHQILDRVRTIAANGVADGLTLKEHYDPSLPPVFGDEDQLIQVFLNIVKNAADAAHARGDGRGEVSISTGFRHGARVRSANGQGLRGAPLEVRITDNGPGVPTHLKDCLFEPFVTTKSFGAGLGLPLCSKLVTAHGGLIDFESEPGRTTFRILLPIEA